MHPPPRQLPGHCGKKRRAQRHTPGQRRIEIRQNPDSHKLHRLHPEFSLYQWNEKAGGDVPLKEHDHAMDDLRYFVSTILAKEEKSPFFVASLSRSQGMFHVEHSGG